MELAPIAEALSSFARFRVQRYTKLLIYKLAAIKNFIWGAKDKNIVGHTDVSVCPTTCHIVKFKG